MLKEQQMPWSVGKALNIAEHGTGWPFHSQYLKKEISRPIKGVDVRT